MAADATHHDRSGLLLDWSPVPTEADINQAELQAMAKASAWVRQRKRDPKTIAFWFRLHQEIFGEIWRWAGQQRSEATNIGVPPHRIREELGKLQDDLTFWLGPDCDMAPAELLARFHHRVVWIHPFTDGNGRWGRLVTDALAIHALGLPPLDWADDATALRVTASPRRDRYIASLKRADHGDYRSLIDYLCDFNDSLPAARD